MCFISWPPFSTLDPPEQCSYGALFGCHGILMRRHPVTSDQIGILRQPPGDIPVQVHGGRNEWTRSHYFSDALEIVTFPFIHSHNHHTSIHYHVNTTIN